MAQNEMDDLYLLYNATRSMTLPAARHEVFRTAAQRIAEFLNSKGVRVEPAADDTPPESDEQNP